MFGLGSMELIIVMLMIALWIWALVDILKSDFTGSNKIIWLLVVILFHMVGALLYVLIGRGQKLAAQG